MTDFGKMAFLEDETIQVGVSYIIAMNLTFLDLNKVVG